MKSREGKSVYDFECKLADLGLSHFKKNTSLHAETIDVDTRGTRAYGTSFALVLKVLTANES